MTKRKKKGQGKGRNPQNNSGTGSSYNSNHGDGANKRPRHNSSGNGNNSGFDFDASKGYVDPATGQRGAFPGLEGEPDDFYGPASDGMDYLRMVRSEAKGVPTLLVAGQKTRTPPFPIIRSCTLNYDDDEPAAVEQVVDGPEEGEIIDEQGEDDDEQGWYSDGAYTAAVDLTITTLPAEPLTALSLWHNALLTSFRSVRKNLHANPPTPPLPLAVSPSLPVRKQRSLWQQHIFNTRPTPKELWGIDQQTVLRLLKWLTQRMSEMAKHQNGRCWSQWLWGLLMRLDDCLTADETSIVRELGKRCLIIRERMAVVLQGKEIPDDQRGEAEGEEEGEEGEEEEEEGEEGEEEEEEGIEEVQGFDTEQDEGTVTAPAAEKTEQAPDAPTASKIEAVAESEVTPQLEAILETTPLTQAVEPAETEEANGLALASRIKAALQSIQNQKSQEPPQPGQKRQSKSNGPISRTANSLSQSDTFGVLDMVISLVGDFYGQKDLLADRKTPIHLSAS